MHPSALWELLCLVDQSDLDEYGKREFKKMVRAVSVSHGVGDLAQRERVEYAVRLLRERQARAEIRERLMAAYGISRATAYRVIGEALQLSHVLDTPPVSTGTHEEVREGVGADQTC